MLIYSDPKFPTNTVIGIWEWRPIQSSETWSSLEQFKKDGINTVYLDISDYIEMPNDQISRQLAQYLISAHSTGIKVHALVGSPLWTRPSHQYLLAKTLEFVQNAQRNNISKGSLKPSFDGVQFDLEPYTLSEFSQDPDKIMIEYLDGIDQIVAKVKDAQAQGLLVENFPVGIAIPYWFDSYNSGLNEITWKGENKTVFRHIVKIMNNLSRPYFIVMAYRPVFEGDGGVIASAKSEIQFVNQYAPRVKIIIGQEFKNNPLLKNKNNAISIVDQITASFKDFPVYSGVSFNDAKTYSLLHF